MRTKSLFALETILAAAFAAAMCAALPALAQVVETDQSMQFNVGSNGYQANIPAVNLSSNPPSINVLANPTTTLTLSNGAPASGSIPDGGNGTSNTWATLTDGSYGTVPNAGGGGPGEVAVQSGWTLTYTFNQAYPLTNIDIFTGWGDGGRFIPTVTVDYSTNGTTFIPLTTVNYTGANGNGAWVDLSNLGIPAATAVQFNFGNQQNGYVGYTELAAVTPVLPITWTGSDATYPMNWTASPSVINWNNPNNSIGPVAYQDNQAVLFDDSVGTGSRTVDISDADVSPASVTFSSSATYTLNGTFAITGSAGLTKQGSGLLIVNNTNTYSGLTNVSAGTLQLGNVAAIPHGAGMGNVNVDGVLDLNGLSPTFNALSGAGTVASSVSGAINLTLGDGDASGVFNGALQDGSGTIALTKIGAGVQTMGGTNSYSGGTTISSGVLSIGSTASLPGWNANGNYSVAPVRGPGRGQCGHCRQHCRHACHDQLQRLGELGL